MSPIRVLIFPLPRLLHDVLRQLLSDIEGVEIVDHHGRADLAEAATTSRADLVIASERDAAPAAACALLQAHPVTRTLAVSDDGCSGALYELRPHRELIGELSATTVRRAVRAPSFGCLSDPAGSPPTTNTAP